MSRYSRFALAALIFAATLTPGTHGAVASEPTDAANPWIELFDGQTLSGWQGDREWFRVENGSIVAGRMDRPIEHNQFLCTTKQYDDFELTLEIKLVGPGDNAGVQFRSRRDPDSTEVIGYQADAGSAWDRPVWGGLYDESRRREMLSWPDPKAISQSLGVGQWNTMRIKAVGPSIQIAINSVVTTDYTETDSTIADRGVIALQIHSGPASEAHYRNIRLRPIPTTSAP